MIVSSQSDLRCALKYAGGPALRSRPSCDDARAFRAARLARCRRHETDQRRRHSFRRESVGTFANLLRTPQLPALDYGFAIVLARRGSSGILPFVERGEVLRRVLRGCFVALLGALGIGCRGEPSGEKAAAPAGIICSECSAWSAPVAPSGAGSQAEPTPCQKSEQLSPIDEATARELGFGAKVDQVTRSFTSSLRWTPRETEFGAPASGFAPVTGVTGRTTPTAFEHVVPSLAGCEDSLRVTLDVSFQTHDGALAIEGFIVAGVARSEPAPSAYGTLDLSGAQGSLRLFPTEIEAPFSGSVGIGMYFFPDQVRAFFGVSIFEVRDGETSSDVRSGRSYYPLDGQFPNDACYSHALPATASEPGAAPDGRSMAELRSELQGMLDRVQPLTGSWGGGRITTLTSRIGEPASICVEPHVVGYKAPLAITSADGTIRIDREANGSVSFAEDGTLLGAWLEIYDDEPILPEDFAAKSGVQGVEFGSHQAARWYTDLYFVEAGVPGVHGIISVEAIDLDGSVTGSKYAVVGPFATFSWAE